MTVYGPMCIEAQEPKIETFSDLLKEASKKVTEDYFKLPIASKVEEDYRERVYCYELYHQMRCLWSRFHNPDKLTLTAEVDKRGHEHFIKTLLDSKIPDFLVHVAGGMGNNHTVMEVKTAKADSAKLSQDLIKLNDFMNMRSGAYQHGILLIFGDSKRIKEEVIKAREKAEEARKGLKPIDVWIHDKVGIPAYEVTSVSVSKAVTEH
ncbi:MAG TPA: hypothetical protein DDZ88_21240 [Verrucomicrobiales bacterium]|nr:hypothetical protein [Verrucomicrobiales bacterium]